jgi:predicted nucleic acid-binding protein
VHAIDLTVTELRRLANHYGLCAYDAAYLALALEHRMPIACGDRPLKVAMRRAGVKLA